MPVRLSDLRPQKENSRAHTESFGDVELRCLTYADATFAHKLLRRIRNCREFTARLLHHQLVNSELSFEEFSSVPDDELKEIARAYS